MFMRRFNFNLSCLILNCVTAKLFLDYSGFLLIENGSGAALAIVLSALLFSIIALAIYPLRGTILEIVERRAVKKPLFAVLAAYFICEAIYYSYSLINDLGRSEYLNTTWILILIVLAAAVFIVTRGGKGALFKLHGLCVPVIAAGLIFIILNALPRCDVYNAAPIFGSGARTVVLSAFKNIFAFSGIILPAAYLLLFDEERKSKHIIAAAIIGAALYALYYIVLFLSINAEYAALGGADLTRVMAGFSGMSRLNMRLDALYIIIKTALAILYISALLTAVKKLLASLGFSGKEFGKSAAAVFLCALIITPLAGCGDARDVENTAYIISVGVDPVESADGYNFTLQFSNPLKNGSDTSAETSDDTDDESGGGSEKKAVSNITVGARNIFEALEKSKSYLGKSAALSHMKLLVISNDLLNIGPAEAEEICKSFLSANEVRPETKLCAAENSREYLTSVEPAMEESPARYYELLFSEKSAVVSFETNLLEFVTATGGSAHMAEVTASGLNGGILFPAGASPIYLGGDECSLLNTALGKTDEPIFFETEDGEPYYVRGKCRAKTRSNIENGCIYGSISLRLACPRDASGNISQIGRVHFEESLREIIKRMYAEGADIFELRKRAKMNFLTDTQYNEFIGTSPVVFIENPEIKFYSIN